MPDQLAAKIAARKHADELLEFVLSKAKSQGEFARNVLIQIRDSLAAILNEDAPPIPSTPHAMNEQEARDWERRTRMPFGKHEGELVKDVPIDYLLFIDEGDPFKRNLRRYLNSPAVQREQPGET